VGTIGIVVGILGLAFTAVSIAVVASGSTEAPQTIMAIGVTIQSVVNVVVGWALRRRAAEPEAGR
jgi:hypothetical protein